MAYRFVHAADIHLDSPLRSLALRNPELAALIGNATRRAFERIVDLCLHEAVDALILAGDLYDGDQTSMKTARFLAEQVRRLHEAGVRTFVIRGNHDALSKITKEFTFPETVSVYTGRGEAIAHDRVAGGGFDVVVHGLSFAQPHASEGLLPKYRPPVAGAVNIGIMHTSLGGAEGHDPYAPCAPADLHAFGFDYWALGHIHRREVVKGSARSTSAVVMPGMPQGRDINEAGAKSVTLVTISDDRSIRIEERLTSVAQFERVPVDLDGIEEWGAVVAAIDAALGTARDAAPSEHLVARLRVAGITPLAWRLRRDLDLLKAEAEDRASVLGRTWIEKIEMDCAAPSAAASRRGVPPGDPFAELRQLIDEDVLHSDAFRAEMAAVAEELRLALPPECRGLLGSDPAGFDAALAAIVADGAEDVLARLHGAAASEPA
jgi:exonuclease SbcD